MGLQDKIIQATVGLNGEESFDTGVSEKAGVFARGTLALGVPGNIYDATPARIMTTVLTAAAAVGTFVTGLGVIVNPREYANKGTAGNPLAPSLMLPAGSVAEVCTFGHIVVSKDDLAAILAGMNGRVIVGDESKDALVVVEIDGLKAAADDGDEQ